MRMHRPTSEEKTIIRDCAKREARRRAVELQIGERYNIAGRHTAPARGEINIAFITDDPENWDDTDLQTLLKWSHFTRGFLFADGGSAIIDFWVYSYGRPGELQSNVTAYWKQGKLARVEGTANGVMWKAK